MILKQRTESKSSLLEFQNNDHETLLLLFPKPTKTILHLLKANSEPNSIDGIHIHVQIFLGINIS